MRKRMGILAPLAALLRIVARDGAREKTRITKRNVRSLIVFVIIGSFFMTMISIPSNVQAVPGGWGSSTTLLETGTGDASSPQVAMDGIGHAIAVWVQTDSSGHQSIFANRLSVFGTWGTATVIETGTGDASSPQVAMDGIGHVLVVWVQAVGTNTVLYSNTFKLGLLGVWGIGTWGTAQPVEAFAVLSLFAPHIAMDENGNAMAMWCQRWVENDGTRMAGIFANRLSAGVWETPKSLEQGNSQMWNFLDNRIAMNSYGVATAIWQTHIYMVQSETVHAARYESGAWSAVKVLVDIWGWVYNARVAMDNNGDALVVWSQLDRLQPTDQSSSQYAVFHAGTWGASTKLTNGYMNQLQIAMGPFGKAITVWDVGGDIYSRTFSPPPWA
jgi:hypothetical protein